MYFNLNNDDMKGKLQVLFYFPWNFWNLLQMNVLDIYAVLFKFDKKKFHVHTEKSFLNLVEYNRNQILFSILRFIWSQMEICLVPNQSENGKYNLILVWFNKIEKSFQSNKIGEIIRNVV